MLLIFTLIVYVIGQPYSAFLRLRMIDLPVNHSQAVYCQPRGYMVAVSRVLLTARSVASRVLIAAGFSDWEQDISPSSVSDTIPTSPSQPLPI